MNSLAEVHSAALNLNMQKYCADIFSLPLFLLSSSGLVPGDGINSIAETLVKPSGTSQAEEPVVFLQAVLQITAMLQAGPDQGVLGQNTAQRNRSLGASACEIMTALP